MRDCKVNRPCLQYAISVAAQTTTSEVGATQQLTEPTESDTSSVKEITTYSESAMVAQTQTPSLVNEAVYRFANPFRDQTPVSLLSRSYQIDPVFIWTIGTPFIHSLVFPTALIDDVPALSEYLRPFRYFRASVKIEIRVNSTQYHYGSILVSWLPNVNGSNIHIGSIYRESGNNPIVLSAATQQSCTVIIPWVNPRLFARVDTMTGEIGTLYFRELNPLRKATAEATDTVTVTVFASFVDPQVAGYRSSATPVPMQRDKAQAQSKRINPVNKEGQVKAKDNSLTSDFSPLSTLSSILKSVPIVGDTYQKFVNIVKPLAEQLDKPNNESITTPVVQAQLRDFANGDGVDNGNLLALDRRAILSTEPGLMGWAPKSFTEMAQVPMLIQTTEILNSTAPFALLACIPRAGHSPAANRIQPDYFHAAANYFRYWRGSIKYKLQFFCSSFVSCRFRLSLVVDGTVHPPLFSTAGDFVSRVVDVKGDTVLDITVPYIYDTAYREFLAADATPSLYLSRLTSIISISPADDPSIFVNVWRSAGEDIEFAQYVGLQHRYETQSAVEVDIPFISKKKPVIERDSSEAQSVIWEDFKKSFEVLGGEGRFTQASHFCSAEHDSTIVTALKRYSQMTSSLTILDTTSGVMCSMPQLFLYYRGSLRFKGFTTSVSSTFAQAGFTLASGTTGTGILPERGMTGARLDYWPLWEAEVPQYADNPFVAFKAPSMVSNTIRSNISASVTTNTVFYIAAGEDFEVGFLCAPGNVVI